MEKNLTTGSVGRQLIGFSLPYLLSYLLQTLYGMADLFIIGQYEGVAGTTAVAVGSQVMHMLTVMIVGLAMGTTVSIARAIGADDRPQAAAATGNTVTLFLSLSLVLTAGLLLLRRPITAIMSTPEAAVEGTVRYLTICFLGIPCITAYNILSTIFRGMGDSKSPMIFIFIACLANIALDYLFIGALHLGPAGAALSTSLSQAISVAISLAVIVCRRTMPLAKADLRPQKPVMDAILKIGVPISVQDGFIQISFIVITVIANRRGLTDAAAVGIVEKIIGFLFLVPSSMLSAVSALGAQNLGAGKPERAKQTLFWAIGLACGFGAVTVVAVQFLAEALVGLFTPDQAAVLAAMGCTVYTVERLKELYQSARALLQQLDLRAIHMQRSDGTLGMPAAAPFDRIIVTAGGPQIPRPLLEQLAVDGIMLIPVGARPRTQRLMRIMRRQGRLCSEDLGPAVFVDLVGDHGW